MFFSTFFCMSGCVAAQRQCGIFLLEKEWTHHTVTATEKNRKTHKHPDSCKHKHITLTVSVSYAQTHLPNPALSSALFQQANGFKNKWRAWPFIMFRTLFFLRLECGQECVVALLALRGRKTYCGIMLEEKKKRERGVERQERGWSGDWKRSFLGEKRNKKEGQWFRSEVLVGKKAAHYCWG